MFLYFFWMVVQYVHMILYYSDNPCLFKTEYEYSLGTLRERATIYSSFPPKPKIMLFLSGSYNLTFDVYIKKMIRDIQSSGQFADYQMLVYEKTDKSSIIVYRDVAHYIKHLEGPMSELVIVGFSSGGVVASHVMSSLSDLVGLKKTIVTYDTPYQVHDNVLRFQQNWLYRIDIPFFWIVLDVYRRHYNYDEISPIIHRVLGQKNLWTCGADTMIELICAIHQFTKEEMLRVTGFCHVPDCTVVNIYCEKDPFVNRETDILVPNLITIKKPVMGHCSDMSFSRGQICLDDCGKNN